MDIGKTRFGRVAHQVRQLNLISGNRKIRTGGHGIPFVQYADLAVSRAFAHKEIAVGGKTLAGARRAARLHCKFSPAVATWEVIETYFEECERLGFAGAEVREGLAALREKREPKFDPKSPV